MANNQANEFERQKERRFEDIDEDFSLISEDGKKKMEEIDERKARITESNGLFSQNYSEVEQIIDTLTPSRLNEERFIDLAVVANSDSNNLDQVKDVLKENYGRNKESVRNTIERFNEEDLVESGQTTPKGDVARELTEELVVAELDNTSDIEDRLYSAALEPFGLEDTESNRDILASVINENAISEIDELAEAAEAKKQREAAQNAASMASGFNSGKAYVFEVIAENDEPIIGSQAINVVEQSRLDYVEVNRSTARTQLADWVDQGLLNVTDDGYETTEKGDRVYGIFKGAAKDLASTQERIEDYTDLMSKRVDQKEVRDQSYMEETEELDNALALVGEEKLDLDKYSTVSKYVSKDLEVEVPKI
ncbi:MAG: hypothetical protein H8Z69_01610 [Nanohaloarchaea archaeon]|nr:hypothetical protein [Candidatus Nanohaloarchaea archaeon]